jgi:hypothetical protein
VGRGHAMTAVVPPIDTWLRPSSRARWTAEMHRPRGVLASDSQSPCTPRFLQHLPVLCVTCVILCAVQPSTRKRVTVELYAALTGEHASAGNALPGIRHRATESHAVPAMPGSRTGTTQEAPRAPCGQQTLATRADANPVKSAPVTCTDGRRSPTLTGQLSQARCQAG